MLSAKIKNVPDGRLRITLPNGEEIHIYASKSGASRTQLTIGAPEDCIIERQYNDGTSREYDLSKQNWVESRPNQES